MGMRFFFFLVFCFGCWGIDFDCILIGSSPFSLFEALHQSYLGKKVLILEESDRCGGAWKGIDICGVKNVDMGCHQIGHDQELKTFLEDYAGCHIVSLDHPPFPFEAGNSPNGWYFLHGCHELIDHLLEAIAKTDIVLLTEKKVERIFVDKQQKSATVETAKENFSTRKVIVTPMSRVVLQPSPQKQNFKNHYHYHLYLLIEDGTAPRFSYRNSPIPGVSRMMNLTPFTELSNSGKQLIVLQIQKEELLAKSSLLFETLKNHSLIDPSAHLLAFDSYIYESGSFHQSAVSQMQLQEVVEVLQTGHFQHLNHHISKWKQTLPCLKNSL